MLFVTGIANSFKELLVTRRAAAILRWPVPLASEAQWPLATRITGSCW